MKWRTSMLTKEQVAFYQEHGYLLVERLLTQQEAQELRRECNALAQRLSIHTDMDATWGSARKAVADDAPLEKGCVCVVPGSHKLGPLEHHAEGSWHLPLEQYPLESALPCPARAGDVLFLSYLTIHGSGLNVSNEPRTTLLVQMRDPTD